MKQNFGVLSQVKGTLFSEPVHFSYAPYALTFCWSVFSSSPPLSSVDSSAINQNSKALCPPNKQSNKKQPPCC